MRNNLRYTGVLLLGKENPLMFLINLGICKFYRSLNFFRDKNRFGYEKGGVAMNKERELTKYYEDVAYQTKGTEFATVNAEEFSKFLDAERKRQELKKIRTERICAILTCGGTLIIGAVNTYLKAKATAEIIEFEKNGIETTMSSKEIFKFWVRPEK